MESQGASPIQIGGTRSLRFQRGVGRGVGLDSQSANPILFGGICSLRYTTPPLLDSQTGNAGYAAGTHSCGW